MKKKRYRLSKFFLYLLHIIAIVTFFFVSISFQKKEIDEKVLSTISVVENDNTDYKVYYTQDGFYSESYLKSGGNYTRTRVQNIGIDYDYIVNLTDKASGNYNYKIEGAIYAYDPNDAEQYDNEKVYLWKKSYDLGEPKNIEFTDSNYFDVKEHVDIELQRYIAEYNSYLKSDPTVLSKAVFVVTLTIDSGVDYKDIDNINFNKTIKYEIPISESTFKIKENNTQKSEVKTYNKIDPNEKKKFVVKVMRIFSWSIEIILILKLIYYYYKDVSSKSLYSRQLNKILTTYDSIIVNVTSGISLDNLNVINVKSFSEMIDAQSEVRLPINCLQSERKKETAFILVSDKIAWVYILRESDLLNEEQL